MRNADQTSATTASNSSLPGYGFDRAVEVDAAEVHRSHRILVTSPGDRLLDVEVRGGEPHPAVSLFLEARTAKVIAAGGPAVVTLFDQARDGEVRGDARGVTRSGLDDALRRCRRRCRPRQRCSWPRRGSRETFRAGARARARPSSRWFAPAYLKTCTVSMPEMSEKNQPQLVYMRSALRCISRNVSARILLLVVELALGVTSEPFVARAHADRESSSMYASRAAHGSDENLGRRLLEARGAVIAQDVERATQRACATLGSNLPAHRCSSRSRGTSARRRASSSTTFPLRRGRPGSRPPWSADARRGTRRSW